MSDEGHGDEDRASFQQCIDSLHRWLEKWQIPFNEDKCHVFHIGRTKFNHQYTMGGIQPQGVKKDKGVRVIIAESLRPSLQCAKSAKKANDVIGQLPDLIEEANSTTSFKNGSDN